MEWISINYKSPLPEDGYYLVCCPNYCESGFAVAQFDNDSFSWNIEGDESINEFVTDWSYINLPKELTEVEQYEVDLKKHQEYCENIKPSRERYLTDQAFDLDMSEWSKKLHMDAPNKPSYYRANND